MFQSYDMLGIGIGPFNLSLAALVAPTTSVRSIFFDSKPYFSWHAGLLGAGTTIQTSFLRDLVTPIDPTNKYSFVNFLVKKRRFYNFLNSDFARVLRTEFNEYLEWVSNDLECLRFGVQVDRVEYCDGAFQVHHGDTVVRGTNLVVGTGLQPKVPAFAKELLSDSVLHAQQYLIHRPNFQSKRVVVIGGGQSGAEIVRDVLEAKHGTASHLTWISRRTNFLPLDESAFTNEYFRPAYATYFAGLPKSTRAQLLDEQCLASNGISNDLLTRIYQLLYQHRLCSNQGISTSLIPGVVWSGLRRRGDAYELTVSMKGTGVIESLTADVVIICTGWETKLPTCLSPLEGRILLDGDKPRIRRDFSLVWNGPEASCIYLQNGAGHDYGIADANLSVMAWRSAVIINSIAKRAIYDTSDELAIVDWPTALETRAMALP